MAGNEDRITDFDSINVSVITGKIRETERHKDSRSVSDGVTLLCRVFECLIVGVTETVSPYID